MDAISTIMGVESKVAGAVNAIAGGVADLKDPKIAKKLEKAAKDEQMSKLSRAIYKEKLKAKRENKRFGQERILNVIKKFGGNK